MAHPVKNPPAMWETWVQSLGWEDPLEKGTATHSSTLTWRIYSAPSLKESDTTELLSLHFTSDLQTIYDPILDLSEVPDG